jgi:hypothetical protein
MLIECSLSNQFSDIGEGEVSSIVNSVTILRRKHAQVDDTAKLSCNRLKRNGNKQE